MTPAEIAHIQRVLSGNPAAREESRQRCEEMLERLKRQQEANLRWARELLSGRRVGTW